MTETTEVKLVRVAILGSTGSIGVSTLEVLARHRARFQVFALSAATRLDELFLQCQQYQPVFAVMTSQRQAAELARKCRDHGLSTQVLAGAKALEWVAEHPDVDVVMAAIVGAAGLASCLASARAGKRLLLANKEALVIGGDFFLQAVASGGAKLLPIDSEHSAVFQALPDDAQTWPEQIDKIILTASGGPFRQRDPATFASITPRQACAHPNWVMGQKISVDSATMMNKALEVIEAHYLFGVNPAQIEVVIHPQSVIHSMVQYRDHSVLAQLGTPDMKVPIAFGLAWPQRIDSGAAALDFRALADLSFEAIDTPGHAARFPGLRLAWSSLQAPRGTTAVLNAANEEAVASFLAQRIRFDQIYAVISETLSSLVPAPAHSLDELLTLDAHARRLAQQTIARIRA